MALILIIGVGLDAQSTNLHTHKQRVFLELELVIKESKAGYPIILDALGLITELR